MYEFFIELKKISFGTIFCLKTRAEKKSFWPRNFKKNIFPKEIIPVNFKSVTFSIQRFMIIPDIPHFESFLTQKTQNKISPRKAV